MKALLTALLVITIVATSAIAGSGGASPDRVAQSAGMAAPAIVMPTAPF